MSNKSIRFELGGQVLDRQGPIAWDNAVVCLTEERLSGDLDCLWMVIEGSEEARATASGIIVQAFSPLSDSPAPLTGDYSARLRSALDEVSEKVPQDDAFSLALALMAGTSVTWGTLRGAVVLHISDDSGRVFGRDVDKRVGVYRLQGADAIVLLGVSAATHVSDLEVRQTVHASDADAAATWLSTLGSGRARAASATIVAAFNGSNTSARVAGREEGSASRLTRPIRIGASIGVVAVAALVGVIIAGPVLGASFFGSSKALPLLPARGLQVAESQSHLVQLTWIANHGQDNSLVQVGSRVYRTGRSDVLRLTTLAPGRSYNWRVREVYARQKSAWTGWRNLTIPKMKPTSIPTILSPKGVLSAKSASHVNFCWSAAAPMTRFHLALSRRGHPHIQKLSFTRHGLNHKGKRLCVNRRLAASSHYAFNVGQYAAGYDEAWSKWHHFVISAPVKAAPVTAPVTAPSTVPYSQPAAPVYPTITTQSSIGTTSSTSTGSSSTSTYTAPASTTSGYGVGTTSSGTTTTPSTGATPYVAPVVTPTPAAYACSNPPYC